MAEHTVKCKHKPRFIETSLVAKPDGSLGFETLAQCETCHEQLCIPADQTFLTWRQPMDEKQKLAFLKQMGYSGSSLPRESASDKRNKKTAEIEDMGAARKLYNIFNAQSYQEPKEKIETFEEFAKKEESDVKC